MVDGHTDGRHGTGHPGDELVDLVLGNAEGPRRTAMVAHLARCAACRAELDALTADVGTLLTLAPEVQPPLGFEQRALARMPTGDPTRARRPRRVLAVVGIAAAVLLVAAAAIVLIALVDGGDGSDGDLVALERSDGGGTVGSVSVTDVDGSPSMVVAIVDAPDDVSYICRTTFVDGTVDEVPPWPPGDGAWIVPLPDGTSVDVVELIEVASGTVWSTADFDS